MKTGICVFDLHYPNHDKILFDNILKVAKDIKSDIFLFGGDNMDMLPVNPHIAKKNGIRPIEFKRLKGEYDSFQTEILNRINVENKIWLYGNHEDWIEQGIDTDPQRLEGMIEVEHNLDLSEWVKIPVNKYYKIGKLYFTHGQYTNDAVAKKTVTAYEKSVIFGHSHGFQVYTKNSPVDQEPHAAYQCPCACLKNPDYQRNRPSNWVNGFGVFYIANNGYFNFYPAISIKGKFIFNGKQY